MKIEACEAICGDENLYEKNGIEIMRKAGLECLRNRCVRWNAARGQDDMLQVQFRNDWVELAVLYMHMGLFKIITSSTSSITP